MSHFSNPPLQSAPSFVSQPDRQMKPPGGIFDGSILLSEHTIKDSRIQKTIELLQANLHLSLSLDAIARTVNLSPSHLRALFSEITGLPLAHYVKLLRLEVARHLLATEFLTVKQVMARTGIKDPSHFNRDFKSAYGITPSQYRNRSQALGNQVLLDPYQGNR